MTPEKELGGFRCAHPQPCSLKELLTSSQPTWMTRKTPDAEVSLSIKVQRYLKASVGASPSITTTVHVGVLEFWITSLKRSTPNTSSGLAVESLSTPKDLLHPTKAQSHGTLSQPCPAVSPGTSRATYCPLYSVVSCRVALCVAVNLRSFLFNSNRHWFIIKNTHLIYLSVATSHAPWYALTWIPMHWMSGFIIIN